MNKTQDEMLKIANVLQKMGYSICEYYNAAGFLRIYVDGEPKSLRQMTRMWRYGR